MRSPLLLLGAVALIACQTQAPDAGVDPATGAEPVAATDSVPENGPVLIKGPNGHVRMRGDMRNGKRHGLWTSYHPGGTVQSRTDYVDGMQEGPSVVFHPNGQTYYTGDYRHGRQVGEWRFFDEGGTLIRTMHYDSTGAVINDH